MKKNPFESITHFCLIQMEILKDREFKLRKEIEDCKIQKQFLRQLLQDLGKSNEREKKSKRFRETVRSPHYI